LFDISSSPRYNPPPSEKEEVAMAEPHYLPETLLLRRIAGNPSCRFIWTRHALDEMSDLGISAPDIEFALSNGTIVLHEIKQDILYRAECRDVDGRYFQAVIAIYEDSICIKLVTVF
jgi:hypothetical protein